MKCDMKREMKCEIECDKLEPFIGACLGQHYFNQAGSGAGRRDRACPPIPPIAQFLDSSEAEIIIAYNSEFRGLANYYAIADGVKSSLDALELVMWRSLLATIASKRRTSVPQIKRKLKMGTDYVFSPSI